jgi:hypothetical protein
MGRVSGGTKEKEAFIDIYTVELHSTALSTYTFSEGT